MNYHQLTIEIARLPLPKVIGAYNNFNSAPVVGANKSDCVKWLAEGAANNHFTLDDIKGSPTASVTNVPSAPSSDMIIALRQTEGQANTAMSNASNALIAVGDLALRMNQLSDHLINVESSSVKVTKQLATLTKRIGEFKIDDRDLAKAVGEAIAAEFEPFKQAVRDVGAESVVADLLSIRAVDVLGSADVFNLDVADVRGNTLAFSVWNSPDSPEIDPDFIWTPDILRHLSLSDATGENLWFGGEKGTGKSETARQFAARTGRSFKRINFHKHTSAEEYLGATGLVDGNTVFEPKDFLTAFTTPSTVILLDEITNADAGELAPLNGLLEPNACVSYGGQVWRRAAGVLIFAADNTFGSGDESGRYTGTRNQNSALIDRFSRIIPFTFLPKQQEIEAIASRSGCTTDLARHVYAAIHMARGKVEKAEIVDAPSIRSAIAFCRACKVLPPDQAWETTIVARQPSESAATLRGIFEVCINKDTIANNI